MLNLNDKLALLLDYCPNSFGNFQQFVEKKYKYPYHVLSNNNIQEAITEYCLANDLCEDCLDKKYCECSGEKIYFQNSLI
jgi:hypothetical protein